MPFAHGCEFESSTDAAILLVGQSAIATGGFIYEFFKDATTSFDGAAIDGRWMTKTLYGLNEQGQPAITTTKRWRWMDLLFRASAAASPVTVEWLEGGATDEAEAIGAMTITPQSSTLISADGSTILSADGSALTVALSTAQGKAQLHDTTNSYLHSTGMRLRVSTNNTTASWFFEAMQIAYQLLPGQKRRFQ